MLHFYLVLFLCFSVMTCRGDDPYNDLISHRPVQEGELLEVQSKRHEFYSKNIRTEADSVVTEIADKLVRKVRRRRDRLSEGRQIGNMENRILKKSKSQVEVS